MRHPLQEKLVGLIEKRDEQADIVSQLEQRVRHFSSSFQEACKDEEVAKVHASAVTEAFVVDAASQEDLDAAKVAVARLTKRSEDCDEKLRAARAQLAKSIAELKQCTIRMSNAATRVALLANEDLESKIYSVVEEFAVLMQKRHAIALGCTKWATWAASEANGQRTILEPINISNPSSGMLRKQDPQSKLWDDGLVGVLSSRGILPSFAPAGGLAGLAPELMATIDLDYTPPPDEAA